jgi:hypothetical protein
MPDEALDGFGLVAERRPMRNIAEWEEEDLEYDGDAPDSSASGTAAIFSKFRHDQRLGAEEEGREDDDIPNETTPFVKALKHRCYLCEGSGGQFRDLILNRIINPSLGHVKLEYICQAVAKFYRHKVFPHTRYIFRAADVRTHLLEHSVDIRAVIADASNKLAENDADFTATARQYDENGTLLPPDPATVKAHREVLKDRIAIAKLYEGLGRK